MREYGWQRAKLCETRMSMTQVWEMLYWSKQKQKKNAMSLFYKDEEQQKFHISKLNSSIF